MLRTRAVTAVLAAGMLLLAGCTGGLGGLGGGAAEAGTVTLYVSDQPGAMDDFEHLNVTVDRVAYHRADASGDADADAGAANGSDAEGDLGEDWETYDVDDRTVDLTRLQGENATVVGQQRLPNGTYDKVFLYVSDVDGTLDDGSSARVKLPSGKLQLEKRFTVGANESLDFVFDATVVKAGNSGKYVLTPVVSESGTDVPIQEVARDDDSGLSARFLGTVDRGEATTVKVTRRGRPVAGATVSVGDWTYQTGGDGTVTFDVPADVEELEVEVTDDDAEVDLKRTFAERDGDGAGGREGGGDRGGGARGDGGEGDGDEGEADDR